MTSTRRLTLAAWTLVFTGLSVALTLAGLSLLAGPMGGLWMKSGVVVAVGVLALAGGQYLFMATVADRWFPKADERLVGFFEVAWLAAFLGGLASVSWMYLSNLLGG